MLLSKRPYKLAVLVDLDFRCQGTATSSASDSGLDDPMSVPDVSEPSEAELRQYEPSFMRMLARTKTKPSDLKFLYDIMRREENETTSVHEKLPRFPGEYVEEFNFERVINVTSFYGVGQLVVDINWIDIDFGHSTTCSSILIWQLEFWQTGL